MGVLVVGDNVLDFGLEEGYHNFSAEAVAFLKKQGVESSGPVSFMTYRIGLMVVCCLTGVLLTFPGLRQAKLHLDSLKYNRENRLLQMALHVNYVLPAIVVLLWVKPVGRDVLCGKGTWWSKRYLYEGQFESLRIVAVVVMVAVRVVLMPVFMQAHLNMAHSRVERLKKESGKIGSLELQKTVARVFFYLCMVACQYAAPLLLLLNLSFLLKVMGDLSWAQLLGDSFADMFVGHQARFGGLASPVGVLGNGTEAASILETAAHFSVTLGDLRAVFTPLWYKGLFSFLLWWVSAAWFTATSLGVMFYSSSEER